MRYLILIIALVLPLQINAADIVLCSGLISSYNVQGDREDDPSLGNRLWLQLVDSNGAAVNCNGTIYIHIDNDKPGFDSMLSTALAAVMTNRAISVWVNPSNTIGPPTYGILSTEIASIVINN